MTAPTTTTPPAGAAGRVERLAAHAAEAAAVRALTTDPDVIALRVERVRAQVDALLWAGIVLGLAFTMVNVQSFAATGAARWSAGWWVAWLLDPMVSLVLLAVLRAEQVTARYQVPLTVWGRRTKWLTFAATYVMNTWTSWGLADGPFTAAGVVLHSVPPLVVFATAETGPGLRDRLTEAVRRALVDGPTGAHARPADAAPLGVREATCSPLTSPITATPVSTGHQVHGPALRQPVSPSVSAPVNGPAGLDTRADAPRPDRPSRPAEPARASRQARPARRRTAPAPAAGRRLLADYITDARAALDTARAAGEAVEVTPAWCRRVTGCSAGTSVKVAAALRANPVPPVPDVPAPVSSARREEAA